MDTQNNDWHSQKPIRLQRKFSWPDTRLKNTVFWHELVLVLYWLYVNAETKQSMQWELEGHVACRAYILWNKHHIRHLLWGNDKILMDNPKQDAQPCCLEASLYCTTTHGHTLLLQLSNNLKTGSFYHPHTAQTVHWVNTTFSACENLFDSASFNGRQTGSCSTKTGSTYW